MKDGTPQILIMGCGAFGTALAIVLVSAGKQTTLWGRNGTEIHEMLASRENIAHLPGFALPAELAMTADPDCLATADLLLLAVPAQATRRAAEFMARHVKSGVPVVACAKGLELETGLRQSQILAQTLPHRAIAVLSGPSLAREIAARKPTEVAIAAGDAVLASRLSAILHTEEFTLKATDDVLGVEIAGSIKNVLAIACGIVVGTDLGEGAHAIVLARGLSEMVRLGMAAGARMETFLGPAGISDLVLASSSTDSRNMAFGIELGRGSLLANVAVPDSPLPEGARTASMLMEMARAYSIRLPIVETIAAIVSGALPLSKKVGQILLS